MTDQRIKIDTSASVPPPKKRRRWLYWLAASAILCYLASFFALFPAFVSQKLNPQVPSEDPAAPHEPTHEVPVDDSQLQWISPTSGPALTLEYIPPGTQLILHLRPAELFAQGEGEKILAALGPWGERAAKGIEEATAARLSDIESLLIGLHRVDGRWNSTLRAAFREPLSQAPTNVRGRDVFLSSAGQGRVLVSCPSQSAAELKQQGADPALLARDLERLLPLTDAHRSATLLMPAKFLDTEGRELVVDGGEKLIAAFDVLVPDNASAVLLSADWRENFFCELAATIVQNAAPHRFNAKLAAQLEVAREQMSKSLASNPPHVYGKAVEERFPAMLRALSDYTRVSHKNGIALARCYLPLAGGHNLLFASRLRLSDDLPATKMPQPSLPLADRLRQVTTLSFPKETLENALAILAIDTTIPIQIAGRDLQLEGITRNQTFTLDMHDRPAEEILVEVLRRANPDREASGPADPRQKLVYVLRENAILVTTRAAAGQRGEELPEVFRVKEP